MRNSDFSPFQATAMWSSMLFFLLWNNKDDLIHSETIWRGTTVQDGQSIYAPEVAVEKELPQIRNINFLLYISEK